MSEAQDRPVRLVGRCELFGEIGSGGMATVHLGRLAAAGGFAKIVAIKRMHEQLAKDPEFVDMFLDEARLAARLGLHGEAQVERRFREAVERQDDVRPARRRQGPHVAPLRAVAERQHEPPGVRAAPRFRRHAEPEAQLRAARRGHPSLYGPPGDDADGSEDAPDDADEGDAEALDA